MAADIIFSPAFGGSMVNIGINFYSGRTEATESEMTASGYFSRYRRTISPGDRVYLIVEYGLPGQKELVGIIGSDYTLNAGDAALVWVPVAAYSDKWTSTADVALADGGRTAIMRGKFTSNVDNNSDPCGELPAGYEGNFSKMVSVSIAGSKNRIKSEDVTWSGGASTLSHSAPGVAASDHVTAFIKNPGTEFIFSVSAVCGTNTVDFTLPSAATSNDLVIYYQVERDNAVRWSDIGTDGAAFGMSPNFNAGDFVWVDFEYPIS